MNKVLVDYKYTNEDVVNTLKLLSPRTTNMNPVRIGCLLYTSDAADE